MRSLSTKLSLAILAAVILVIALIGVIWEYAHERSQMREHAEARLSGRRAQHGCPPPT